MSTFILVHGAAHGGWCWYKVVALLEQQGHTVVAPDLPSHGRDKTPLSEVTLAAYEDIALARALLVPQALAPLYTPAQTSAANFGRVPRVFIECLQDRAMTPARQKQLYTAQPCQQVITLDTSHSPFFSAPSELAAHLVAL